MLIKLTTSRVLESGHTQNWGEVVEMSADEGRAVIEAGQGVEWPSSSSPAAPESGMISDKRGERAVKPTPKHKG